MGSRSMSKRGSIVPGSVRDVTVAVLAVLVFMWNIAGAVWDISASIWTVMASMLDVTDAVWAITSSMHVAHAL